MVSGYQLRDQKEWEKFRLLAYFSSVGSLKTPIRRLDEILKLPLLDGKTNDRVEQNIEFLLGLKKEADERKKQREKEQAPAAD